VFASAQSGEIVVYKETASVPVGTTRQFTKYVSVSNAGSLIWSVNDIPGGNAVYGTVTSTGLYAAPVVAPPDNVLILKATSTNYPSKFGKSTVTLVQPTPWAYGCSPLTIPTGNFTIKVTGVGYTPTSIVQMALTNLTTTYVSPTELKATGTQMTPGKWPIRVYNPGPGAVTGAVGATMTVNAAPVAVTVSPASKSLAVSATQQFTSTVTGNANTAVVWSVNGVAGGSAATGTVSPTGLYTAPAVVPNPASVSVRATASANGTSYAQAAVTITAPLPPAPAVSSVTPSNVPQGSYAITVDGSNFAAASQIRFNGVALATTYVNATQLTATGNTAVAVGTSIPVTVSNPGPPVQVSNALNVTITAPASGVSFLSAARFLDQAAFGPTPAEIANVQNIGYTAWLNAQFALPETFIPMPASNNNSDVSGPYVNRMAHAPDQLRQKTIYALQQIIVISANKNIYPPEIVPYLQTLSKHAFGNYKDLLKEITLSSQMGKYLDMANSTKPGAGMGANENYPREVIQLFTAGLVQLNLDGTPKLDANGKTIPTYTQANIGQFALALTGWTYPGPNPTGQNWENFSGPMVPRENLHSTVSKTLLNGAVIPAGTTCQQDVDAVIDNLFNHPNVAPFIATRLIRILAMSNPTPAFVQRVAQVFENNGQGVRGDLKATVKAILTDAEARNDTPSLTSGRLKEPLYYYVSLARQLGGQVALNTGLDYLFDKMGQRPLSPNSVFSFFSPSYRIPNTAYYGPEFQIYSPTESLVRADMLNQILTGQYGMWTVNRAQFNAVAADPNQLLDAVDKALLYGRMSPAMRTSLLTVMAAAYDNAQRVDAALYLTALSGQYSVQH